VLRFKVMVLLFLVFAVPCAYAAEPAADGDEAGKPVVKEKPMTQAELAAVIIRMLGIESEIDQNAGAKTALLMRPNNFKMVYIDFMRSRGIQPLGGWKPNEEVTKEVLAVVVVQVLGLLSEVEDPEDPDDYVAVLEEHDLILTNVRDVLSEIEVINLVQIIPGSSPYDDNLSAVRGF